MSVKIFYSYERKKKAKRTGHMTFSKSNIAYYKDEMCNLSFTKSVESHNKPVMQCSFLDADPSYRGYFNNAD